MDMPLAMTLVVVVLTALGCGRSARDDDGGLGSAGSTGGVSGSGSGGRAAGSGGRAASAGVGSSGGRGGNDCVVVQQTPYPDCGESLEGMPCSPAGVTSSCCAGFCAYCQGAGGAQAYVSVYGCLEYSDGLRWRPCGSSNGATPDCGDLSDVDGCSRPKGHTESGCDVKVYWHNPSSGRCEAYRSCTSDGISNRFATAEECEAMCGGPQDADGGAG